MQFLKSLIFNIFLYLGLVTIFILAVPTLILPDKFTLFFGRLSAKYIVFLLKVILNTKVIHPKTIQPLKKKGITLRIKSFINEKLPGTIIEELTTTDHDLASYIIKEKQIVKWIFYKAQFYAD